jgi:hypothetical protein
MRQLLAAGLPALVLLLGPQNALARIWYVPTEVATVGAACDSAAAGDSVVVACGTYHEHDIAIPSGVTVRSTTGLAECVVIDAQHKGRGFECVGVDTTTTIEGFTVLSGEAGGDVNYEGGGIYCANAAPVIRNCEFRSCQACFGGGLFCRTAAPTIVDCRFIDNVADYCCMDPCGEGGGAACYDGSHGTFVRVEFRGNRAGIGPGGIVAAYATTIGLESCVFQDNIPAVLECTEAAAVVTGCTFYGSGEIEIHGSSLVAHNSVIAYSSGKGVDCGSGGTAALYCCDVYGNVRGDWVDCLTGQEGLNGNFSADPMFCSPGDDLHIADTSPCAPAQQPECGLIGALPVSCTTGTHVAHGDVASIFFLGENTPNPFGPRTTVTFGLPPAAATAPVSLCVFDVAGRLVRTLVDGYLGAGRHRVTWEGDDDRGRRVAGGTYFCRLQWNGESATGRMVLAR